MENGNSNEQSKKKEYIFGEIKEYDLEKIEQEILKESVYLDVFAGSDIVFKEDCKKLDAKEISQKLTTLNAYSFKYKTDEYPEYQFAEGDQFGFMAQELEEVFPELVRIDTNGNRIVNYTQIIPLMFQTIKHLSANIDRLENKINHLSQN